MRYYKQICFSLFFMFCGLLISAQEKNEEQVLLSDQSKFITLSQVNNNLLLASDRTASGNTNSVFIQQIGADNTIVSNIVAKTSDIKLFQNGNSNTIEIDESSKEINKLITQNGNNNSVIDFSFNPDISTNLELIQNGDNLTFERFGSNELSKNLKFNMSGNARTIIIRSF
ncbi:hypothetical protein [Aquimarina sp. MMG016]|uniref:hypothetical protein n=1 Tax=Aquimarina sp. MMG016 TaxID=2822690 RepID=UPI001B39F48C|nr:hypothetical protein [Aquimarina sp. MMG016]MBQ4820511.1 hypothetical protein [Aquimarina sp. MMG016]